MDIPRGVDPPGVDAELLLQLGDHGPEEAHVIGGQGGGPPAAEAGVPVSFKLISGPGTAGRILDQKPFTLISEDGTGGTVLGRIISDKFAQGHTYERWRGAAEGADASSGLAIRSSAQRTSFTVPYESTFLIAETIGVDAEE